MVIDLLREWGVGFAFLIIWCLVVLGIMLKYMIFGRKDNGR
jgi:hypothetical protein